LIAETNQTGQMLAEYVYLGDQLLAMIKPGELAYYFHNDHLGTPQVLTDDSQVIAWKAVYTPFGDAVASIQTVDNPFRFPGQYYDQETGLHYNYFRYYNPQTGRYITPDPIGLEGGINLFTYVEGNPVRWVDPWGLRKVILGPYRIGPTGQSVPIVHDTETGRNTIGGFPKTDADLKERDWVLKFVGEFLADLAIDLITAKRSIEFLLTREGIEEALKIFFPPPAEACPKQ
jgi:RHS repeat-associated protein